jgi:hypothetical protein
MPDQQPSASYTIDDLPFLTLMQTTTRAHEIVKALGADDKEDGYWGDAAILARRKPGELIHTPWTDAEGPIIGAEIRLARGDDPRTLEYLAFNSRFAETLMYVASNVHTTVKGLMHLTSYPPMIVCQTAAKNPSLPVWAMDVVYDGGVFGARSGLMLHPEAPQHLIDRAATEPDTDLRACAGACRRANASILAHLASDPEESVRAAVARNPGTPVHLLDGLAVDLAEEVVIALVLNESVPGEVFDAVADRWVRKGGKVPYYAATAPRVTAHAAWALLKAGFADALARNSQTPADVLREIYRRGCAGLREDVVRNESCPHPLRRQAATEDRSSYVRRAAACNLPPGEDPRVYATLDDLTPGMTVLIEKGAAGLAESFLMAIHSVGAVEDHTYTSMWGDESHDYQVVTLTGIRRRLNGAIARRYPGLVTYRVILSGIRIPL